MIISGQEWQVTALLFSGRRNPVWNLSVSEQDECLYYWNQMKLSGEKPDLSPRLGYAGLKLEVNTDKYWIIRKGLVVLTENGDQQVRQDHSGKLEKYLLQTAPPETRALFASFNLL